MTALVWGGVPGIRESFAAQYTIGTHGVFIVPEWPVRAVIVFGCTLMGIEFAIAAVREFRAMLGGQSSIASEIEGAQDAWI